jgi:nicotinate-nucleotide adenylyltransferase
MNPIGIFGGTFDPIHFGHLRTAFELLQVLELEELRFVPAGDPPHRDVPLAAARLRLAMVRAAIGEQPGFAVDDREVRRDGPSYTVTTLAELREETPRRPVCLVVGMDAFLGMDRWHQWRDILRLAHVAVAHRPGWRAPTEGALGQLIAEHGTDRVADLREEQAGRVFVHPVTQLEISSTDLRDIIVNGRDPRYLVPDAVREIIRESGCYSQVATR